MSDCKCPFLLRGHEKECAWKYPPKQSEETTRIIRELQENLKKHGPVFFSGEVKLAEKWPTVGTGEISKKFLQEKVPPAPPVKFFDPPDLSKKVFDFSQIRPKGDPIGPPVRDLAHPFSYACRPKERWPGFLVDFI